VDIAGGVASIVKDIDKMGHRRPARYVPFGNPLLAHDLAIAAAGLRQMVRRPQDMLTMALAGAMAIGFGRASVDMLADDMRPFLLMGLASFAAISLDLALHSRLRYFRHESVLSPVALRVGPDILYRLFFHLLADSVLAGLICLPDLGLFAKVWVAWWFALLPVQMCLALARLPQIPTTNGVFGFLVDLWRSRHAGSGALSVVSAAAAIVFASALFGSRAIAPGIASLLMIGLMLWYAPIDHAVVTFERIIGHSPASSVRARLRIGFFAASALAIAAVAAGNAQLVAAVVVTALAVAAYKILEILLSRVMGRRQVQLTLACLLSIMLATGVALPWAAALLLIAVAGWLAWRAGRTEWMLW
jgi:hypothetical protein